ncbi:hypothetical protein FPQ18DRAFT_359575 [Pyronema domesticum]|nr:hypothetical protein FPQ18DRAFT_359575 [Pyronema domesticum]
MPLFPRLLILLPWFLPLLVLLPPMLLRDPLIYPPLPRLPLLRPIPKPPLKRWLSPAMASETSWTMPWQQPRDSSMTGAGDLSYKTGCFT